MQAHLVVVLRRDLDRTAVDLVAVPLRRDVGGGEQDEIAVRALHELHVVVAEQPGRAVGAHAIHERLLEIEEDFVADVIPRPSEESDRGQIRRLEESPRVRDDEEMPEALFVVLARDVAGARWIFGRPGLRPVALAAEHNLHDSGLPHRVLRVGERPVLDALIGSECRRIPHGDESRGRRRGIADRLGGTTVRPVGTKRAKRRRRERKREWRLAHPRSSRSSLSAPSGLEPEGAETARPDAGVVSAGAAEPA